MGLYPLYIFTDYGIFALESNDDSVVYSNIIPVSNQITDSDFSSVSGSGMLFFIANKGLYCIKGLSIKYISLTMEEVQYEGVLFRDYLQGSTLHFGVYYRELVIYNPNYKYCYLYSIETEQFSTRDYDFKKLSFQSIIGEKGIYSFSLPEKDNCPLESYIESNASGLDSSERKKISYFEVVGKFHNESKLRIFGSNDGVKWNEIKSVKASQAKIKKVLGSWRYLKFSIASKNMKIDTIELQTAIRKL